jgi:predicted ATPase
LLPDSVERQRKELEFRSALAAVLNVVKGFTAPETGTAYARARELWEQLGFPSEFLQVPFGLSLYHAFRGELDLAVRLDEDLLRLGVQQDDVAGLVLGHYSSGRNLMLVGQFAASRAHLEKALTLYDRPSGRMLVQQGAILGFVLFCLGYPDQAIARSGSAITEARGLSHPPSLALTLGWGTLLALVADSPVLGEWVDHTVALAAEQGFPFWRAYGTICRGWLRVRDGDLAEGVSLLRTGLYSYRAAGAEMFVSHYLALLARACEIAGSAAESVVLLEDALRLAEDTGECWYTPELNRYKGELLMRQGKTEIATELYRKALRIAREQEAKLWELRAAVSLARLRRDQGRRAECRDLVAPVYGWFTEGFDTPDLKEAKALLDELA